MKSNVYCARVAAPAVQATSHDAGMTAKRASISAAWRAPPARQQAADVGERADERHRDRDRLPQPGRRAARRARARAAPPEIAKPGCRNGAVAGREVEAVADQARGGTPRGSRRSTGAGRRRAGRRRPTAAGPWSRSGGQHEQREAGERDQARRARSGRGRAADGEPPAVRGRALGRGRPGRLIGGALRSVAARARRLRASLRGQRPRRRPCASVSRRWPGTGASGRGGGARVPARRSARPLGAAAAQNARSGAHDAVPAPAPRPQRAIAAARAPAGVVEQRARRRPRTPRGSPGGHGAPSAARARRRSPSASPARATTGQPGPQVVEDPRAEGEARLEVVVVGGDAEVGLEQPRAALGVRDPAVVEVHAPALQPQLSRERHARGRARVRVARCASAGRRTPMNTRCAAVRAGAPSRGSRSARRASPRSRRPTAAPGRRRRSPASAARSPAAAAARRLGRHAERARRR